MDIEFSKLVGVAKYLRISHGEILPSMPRREQSNSDCMFDCVDGIKNVSNIFTRL